MEGYCNCDDYCKELVGNMEKCVHFMARNHKMELKPCDECYCFMTWHKDGKCCKCENTLK